MLSKVVRPAPGPTNSDATKEARSVERGWGSGGGVAGWGSGGGVAGVG